MARKTETKESVRKRGKRGKWKKFRRKYCMTSKNTMRRNRSGMNGANKGKQKKKFLRDNDGSANHC